MNTSELINGSMYYSVWLGKNVKYLGTVEYKGIVYHRFWEDTMRLEHWLKPEEIIEYRAVIS